MVGIHVESIRMLVTDVSPTCRRHSRVGVCQRYPGTVRYRYKRQLIRLNMKKKWPTRIGMEDSRPIFFCERFSYNENALYRLLLSSRKNTTMLRGSISRGSQVSSSDQMSKQRTLALQLSPVWRKPTSFSITYTSAVAGGRLRLSKPSSRG